MKLVSVRDVKVTAIPSRLRAFLFILRAEPSIAGTAVLHVGFWIELVLHNKTACTLNGLK